MQPLQPPSFLVSVLKSSHVTEVARRASELATQLGLDGGVRARAAAVVQGAGIHLLKHEGGGELFVGPAGSATSRGVQVLALDRGRGLSPAGEVYVESAEGPGMPEIQGSATSLDVYTAGDGTVLAATVYADGVQPAPIGGLSVAAHRQAESGDGWASWTAGALTSLFVCDGVGVGIEASAASRAALDAFRREAERPVQQVIGAVHHALRSTRGAAVALAELDYRAGTLRYCGLGNIAGTVLTPEGARTPLSTARGIAGQVMRPLQVVTAPWTAGSVLVLHSNGLSRQWSLSRYPGLAERRADVIAGVLLRDHKQTREDTAIVIARNPADA